MRSLKLSKFLKFLTRNQKYEKNKSIHVSKRYSTSVLRQYQNQYLRKIVDSLPGMKNILNVGAIPEDQDKEGRKYAEYWSEKDVNFFTLDKNRCSTEKGHFQCDLHDLHVLNNTITFDLILCMSTLEHTENPQQVLQEIKNITHSDGYLYIVVPWFYPLHKDPKGRFGDYWRFNDDSLRLLLQGWEEVWIEPIPSVISVVEDRDMYWSDASLTSTGYCGLFKNS